MESKNYRCSLCNSLKSLEDFPMTDYGEYSPYCQSCEDLTLRTRIYKEVPLKRRIITIDAFKNNK